MRRDPDMPKPEAKRKSRDEGDGNPVIRQRPQYTGKPAARGRYAVLQNKAPQAAHDAAAPGNQIETVLSLTDTLDWLNLWQANQSIYNNVDDEFRPPQSYPSPHL